jgi:hypothetical protein
MQFTPKSRIHVAIPAMNEAAYLPATLSCLQDQQAPGVEVHLWICVNQPNHWWEDPEKNPICLNNRETLDFLSDRQWPNLHQTNPHRPDLRLPNLHLIDRSSPGRGWTGKDHGVGMARKTLMDAIDLWSAVPHDIILSLDADTEFGPNYLASVASLFHKHPTIMGLSNPYYHKLTGDEALDRAMLRYEIYMRHYAVNMWRIGSPYSFAALGSAIALPLRSYRKIGGMTAKKSGEDFYLMQKLVKAGQIIQHNTEMVYPATRYSDRVFFGTGPALIKGSNGNWESYPVYDHRLFDQVGATYRLFGELFERDVQTPMDAFLRKQFCSGDVFGPLRRNAATREQFIKACHQRVDGLRILQFLKAEQTAVGYSDEQNLKNFIQQFYPEEVVLLSSSDGPAESVPFNSLENLDFRQSSIGFLDNIRILLLEKESAYRKHGLQMQD